VKKEQTKQCAKENKDADKKRLAAEKAATLKDNKKVHTTCERVVSKLAPVLMQLENDVTHKHATKVASFASAAVKDSLKVLRRLQAEARQKLAQNVGGNQIAPFSLDLDVVSKHVKEALTNSSVFRQMCVAAENHFQG